MLPPAAIWNAVGDDDVVVVSACQRDGSSRWIDVTGQPCNMKKNDAIHAASDFVESTASWVYASLSLLLAMYGYLMDIIQFRWGGRLIPLTTCSWSEFHHANTTDRYRQLVRLLDELIPTSKKGGLEENEWTDEQLVECIRGSLVARKQTSLLMMRHQLQHDPSSDRENRLCQRLRRLWPQLLRLPKNYSWRRDVTATRTPNKPKQQQQQQSGKVVLSLILPCYRECGLRLQKNLDKVRSRCTQPSRVEVVIVDAGGCRNFDCFAQEEEEEQQQQQQQKKEQTGDGDRWHSVRIVSYPDGGGRGPSLNCGAQHAKGDLYVFGHADTILPHRWDDDIVRSIRLDGAMACAFAFSIDSTCLDTEQPPKPQQQQGQQQQQLPGIRAVEWLVNCRTRYCLLPYGDQVLSMPRQVFDHVGGFPQQCIMEDFDLVRHLRLRALQQGEKFRMIMTNPVETSARRWQRLGVAHVTYTNAILVHQYTHGNLSPSQLFQAYYGRPPSPSSSPPMATPND